MSADCLQAVGCVADCAAQLFTAELIEYQKVPSMIAPAPYSRNRNTQRQRQGVIGSPGLATSRTRAVKVHCELSASQLKVKLMLAQNSCKLDLSESSLEAIPDGVFDLNGLEELSLAGNNIRELPDCFDCLPSLQRLNLAGNRLNKLPDSICALTRLQGLWVHGNVLDTVPSNIGSLCDLVTISLAGNCLPAVPDSLMQLTALTELNIAGNKLERLPGPVSSLSSLQKVLLHGNQLKELPAGFGELESLQVCSQTAFYHTWSLCLSRFRTCSIGIVQGPSTECLCLKFRAIKSLLHCLEPDCVPSILCRLFWHGSLFFYISVVSPPVPSLQMSSTAIRAYRSSIKYWTTLHIEPEPVAP